jgi:hypothetical protein
MADTRVQGQAERWVVSELGRILGLAFANAEVQLTWGGVFEFDAVSTDRRVVACISTSGKRTAGGRPAVGKFHKIRSDTLFLLNAVGVDKRLLVFTDHEMVAHFETERANQRFPPADQIELRWVQLPPDLIRALDEARRIASAEVSPRAE